MKTLVTYGSWLTISGLMLIASCQRKSEPALFASDLTYAQPTLETAEGTAIKSSRPGLTGTEPFTFALTSQPATTALSVDTDGVISASEKLAPGTYQVSLTVTNPAGTQSFDNVLAVLVNSKSGVTFVKDVLPITRVNCSFAGCHPNFLKYQEVAGTITKMLDRVQRAKGSSGFMPRERDALTTTQIGTLKQWVADGMKER